MDLRLSIRAWLLVGVALSGCAQDGDQSACLSPQPRAELGECAPQYPPTFDRIRANTLLLSCAIGTGCHGVHAPTPLLSLSGDEEGAYAALLGHALVIPGDPECSPLIQRLESSDASFRMPRGGELPASERCAIVQWIADGANR
jgi:hypothetical protein